MPTEVKIIADSISTSGKRLTTYVAKYPRYVHSEVMTHRAFSRNASSSRAIPMKTIIRQVISDPVIPLHFGANMAGMSAKKELGGWRKRGARNLWLWSRWPAILFAMLMNKIGLHKQIGNRILEPWCYITTIITATEWDNFYNLRCDKENAHPDIYDLAEKMLAAQNESIPEITKYHIPFVTAEELRTYDINTAMRLSVARCCRVSYLNHDNSKPNVAKDLARYDDLLKNGHMSPFEHQAVAHIDPNRRSGNFVGWEQLRVTIPGNNRDNFARLLKRGLL